METKTKINQNVKSVEHYVIKGDTFYHIKNGDTFDADFKGFHPFSGGCGIGREKTIEQARKKIYNHAKANMLRKIAEREKEIAVMKKSLAQLGDDTFNLGLFKNPNYHGYECNYFNGKKG